MEDAVVPEAEQREIALSDDALIRNKRAETMEKIHIWDERVPFFLPFGGRLIPTITIVLFSISRLMPSMSFSKKNWCPQPNASIYILTKMRLKVFQSF